MMDHPINKYRYELKFGLDANQYLNLFSVINQHPSNFSRLFPDRIVNNVYFDNVHFQCCNENFDGISERVKYRYRWYNELEQFSNGKLEMKIKRNSLGRKAYFDLDSPRDFSDLESSVKKVVKNEKLFSALHNRYERSYFIDRSGKFRLTIDRDISYWQPKFYTHVPAFTDKRIVVEIKFAYDDFDLIDTVTNYFPFRQTKHSKYAIGVASIFR